MKLFKRVGIIGLGLIGGSLGLAIKEKGIAYSVIGISRKKTTLEKARKLKVIDRGFLGFKILASCDLIILATPVQATIRLFSKIKPYLSTGCIVSDVGSTKLEVVNAARKILSKKVDFIGAHPLAGSERRGIDNVEKNLFKGSLCLLTPLKTNKKENVKKVKLFWERLGSKVRVLSPEMHDKVISDTSHLPHLLAFSLIASIPDSSLGYSASGLRDTTRIASSDPQLWTEIFLTNRQAILKSLAVFKKHLSGLSILIRQREKRKLFTRVKQAKLKRDKLLLIY